MKVGIIGNNLSCLALAKALVNLEIFVDIFYSDKKIDIEDLSKLLNQRVNEDFDLIKDAALSGKKKCN